MARTPWLFFLEVAELCGRLLLAIGLRDVWPDIPGLSQAYGANAHVCPDCDGYEACDKRVVVIGNGRRALGMALALTTWTDDITIITNGRPPALDDEGYTGKIESCGNRVRDEKIARVACTGPDISSLVLTVPGVFAAGDITPGAQLAIRAAAAGAMAAMSMHKSLLPTHRTMRDV